MVSRALVPILAAVLAVAGCRAPLSAVAADRAADGLAARREPISTITGDPPNFAQLANGTMMTAVSRPFGRGAKAGALVELYWPHYATDHLWDSYVGLVRQGRPEWAHALRLERQALVPDTGRAIAVFTGGGYRLTIEDVMRPEADVHLRRVTVANTGNVPLEGASLASFAFFTLNHLPGGDRVRVADGALVQQDEGTAVAVVADVPADAARCGRANVPVGPERDARHAAEAGEWAGPREAGPTAGGVDAVTRHPLPRIPVGGSASVTWAIGVAGEAAAAQAGARQALSRGFDDAARADADRWAAYLAPTVMPAGLSPSAKAVYRRALVTLGQHVAANGAIIAAPTNLNPPYRFVWPRDGTLIALTLLRAGRRAEAERFFAFAERLQHADGSYAVNYFPDGRRALWDFGPRGNEHDQPATFAWGVERTFARTGDRDWLAARWPAVRKACEFLMANLERDGLLNTCRDLWELDHDGSWTYSNGAAVAGLRAGAAIAATLGEPALEARWSAAAGRTREAIGSRLVSEGGWLSRGLRRGRLDATVEAANLALGTSAFQVFPDADPRLAATGAAVAQRLGTPGGGIRRYENDQYYDGQPWPVATAWLATHRLALGDREAARAGLDVMTRWAEHTDSLMLGEQFDERKRRWASAFPLAWSEAAYVGLALSLEGR